MMTSFKTYLLNLNFFQSSDPNNQQDEHEYRSNIIATRICIIIFGISLFTFILALWLTPQTNKIILQYPTQEQFQTLPPDAQCPCSRISLSYGQFVSIQPKFHQVCSSDFVSDRWIQSIFDGSDESYFSRADFRLIGSAQFRALASLCELTQASIVQSLASFNMMLMISPYVLSRSVVESQASTSIEQFQLTTANTFQQQLDFVRKMTIGNQVVSALETNIIPIYLQFEDISMQLGYYMTYNISNEFYCNCQMNFDCQVPSGIFNEFEQSFNDVVFDYNLTMLMKIDGFSAGCMPMDSILQSTLQCFYNQTCLNKLLSYFSTNQTFTAMNVSTNSRFEPTSTVREIVNELMVEEWISNISYKNYYNQCAPAICTYSIIERHDPVYVLTKVIGSLGGLTLALTFIIPIIVRYIRRKKDNTERSCK